MPPCLPPPDEPRKKDARPSVIYQRIYDTSDEGRLAIFWFFAQKIASPIPKGHVRLTRRGEGKRYVPNFDTTASQRCPFKDQNFGWLIRLLRHLNRIHKHTLHYVHHWCPLPYRHIEMGKLFYFLTSSPRWHSRRRSSLIKANIYE